MAGKKSRRAKQSLEGIRRNLKSMEHRIRKEYKAEIVGIFGSYARGEQKSKSDVDVLVRFGRGASLFDLVALGDFLEGKLGVKVDVVPERAVRSELRDEIFSEVVAV
jgi:uncharacterized protein